MKGSLQIKNGKYYAVLSTKDENGKYKKIWINTGFEIKGNKKKAEQRLRDAMQTFKKLGDEERYRFADKIMTRIEIQSRK